MAVTGQLPFHARGIATILKKKLANDLTPPRTLVSALSERVERAILRAVRSDPGVRQRSCLEFIETLTTASYGITRNFLMLRGYDSWCRGSLVPLFCVEGSLYLGSGWTKSFVYNLRLPPTLRRSTSWRDGRIWGCCLTNPPCKLSGSKASL
jgi:hypothetical protein